MTRRKEPVGWLKCKSWEQNNYSSHLPSQCLVEAMAQQDAAGQEWSFHPAGITRSSWSCQKWQNNMLSLVKGFKHVLFSFLFNNWNLWIRDMLDWPGVLLMNLMFKSDRSSLKIKRVPFLFIGLFSFQLDLVFSTSTCVIWHLSQFWEGPTADMTNIKSQTLLIFCQLSK